MSDDGYTPSRLSHESVDFPWVLARGLISAGMDEAVPLAQAERLLAERDRQIRAEVLRATADLFQLNTWADVIKGKVPEVLGNAQRVTNWLRDRADVEEHPAGSGDE